MALLQVENLGVSFQGLRGPIEVLRDVGFSVDAGEIVAVVGESGSGKSVTALATMGLLGSRGSITAGRVSFAGRDLAILSPEERRQMRGRDMAMVFQEPGTSLNPIYSVGYQIAEALVEHAMARPRDAERAAVRLMDRVGIPAAGSRVNDYPHQFSGGMKQRIMIAMALACGPKLLIADEPTTALDVTIQAQVLNLALDLREEFGMAMLLITHDMGVVAQMADRVVVMYAGEVVERATVEQLFTAPAHPYTRLLLRSIPSARHRQDLLPVIRGSTPSAAAFPSGCRLHPRCPLALPQCSSNRPEVVQKAKGHDARCFRLDLPSEALERALESQE